MFFFNLKPFSITFVSSSKIFGAQNQLLENFKEMYFFGGWAGWGRKILNMNWVRSKNVSQAFAMRMQIQYFYEFVY